MIFKSLDVASASERVAELFCRNRFGDSAVDIGFERSIAADCATGWTNGNVGQQRLCVTEQRVSSAGERPSVETRVAAAQEGPDEAMRQALAASSAKEASAVSNAKEVLATSSTIKASAASDVDVVEKNQMGGEKPVSMCQTICGVITTIMRDAIRVSEVKYKNFVEQCVRHLPGNAGTRGLRFVKKMAESDGMHKTKSELCRSQSATCSSRTGSCFKSKSEYVTEELGMCCCNKEKRTKIHVKNVAMMMLRGLKRETLCEGDWFERSWQSC